jgi:hypothetical protein
MTRTIGIASSKGSVVSQENSGTVGDGDGLNVMGTFEGIETV